jgi:hypothetical protein
MTDTATRIVQLTARLEVLRDMAYSGVLRVKHGEVETWFTSVSELQRAIGMLEAELRRLEGTSRRPGYIREE